jgi:predicted Rossmann-fold nucleotide-binding protein
MKVLVLGTWNKKKSREYLPQAIELGHVLAGRGHILVASPSSGFQGLVAAVYKQNNGKQFIGYYADLSIMRTVGEEALIEPDERIDTGQDYPIRNILQIKGSDAVIGITGGSGTLTELIASANDYHLPTSFYQGSSHIIDGFLRVDADFAKKIKCGNNIGHLIDYLEQTIKK